MYHASFIPVLTVLTCLAALPAPALARGAETVYQQTLRSTVLIVGKDSAGRMTHTGTGWVVDVKRRLIVTNYHVVPAGAAAAVIFPAYSGGEVVSEPEHYNLALGLPASVIDSDPQNDLAVIQVGMLPEGTVALKLSAANPRRGQMLHVIGNPGASAGLWVYSSGPVRNLVRRRIDYRDGQVFDCRVIEAAISVNPGDSGSAVVNDDGEVVGVVSGGDFSGAVRLMSWAIDHNELKAFLADVDELFSPKTAPAGAFHRRGLRHMRKAEYDRAIADLTCAVRKDGKLTAAMRQRGWAHYLKGDLDTALADYDAVLRREPEEGGAYNERAIVYQRKGQYDRALADFTQAIRLMPGDAVLLANRGVCHRLKGSHDLAIRDHTEALRLDGRYFRAWKERGQARQSSGDMAGAVKDYLAAVNLEKDAETYNYLGVCYFRGKEYEKAAEAFATALKLKHPEPCQVWHNLGYLLYTVKEYDLAIEALTNSLRLNPRRATAWYWRARAYEAKGQAERAKEDLEVAVKLNPSLKPTKQ